MSHSVVVIAPEIDFAVLVACNRGWLGIAAVLVACNRGWLGIAAWKTRQTVKALIRTFAPKRIS